jgi:hypothetical protein
MLQAKVCDCLALDPFAFEEDGLGSSEVDVGRREIVSNAYSIPKMTCGSYLVQTGPSAAGRPHQPRKARVICQAISPGFLENDVAAVGSRMSA